MKIVHNSISVNEEAGTVTKDFSSASGLIYTACAKTFSNFVQGPLLGENLVKWPLSFSPTVRAEREEIYQAEVRRRAVAIGNQVGEASIRAVEFLGRSGPVITMEHLDSHLSLFEILRDESNSFDEDELEMAMRSYGQWIGILYSDGIVPECNHVGNLMLNRSDLSDLVVIDFEMYSGGSSHRPTLARGGHKMIDEVAVDPVVSLALDAGLLAGIKLPLDQKVSYLKNLLLGVNSSFPGHMDEFTSLVTDPRLRKLAEVRSLFFDATHPGELVNGPSAHSYFKDSYTAIEDLVSNMQHA